MTLAAALDLVLAHVPAGVLELAFWVTSGSSEATRLSVPPFGGIGASTLIELAGESGTLTE